MKILITGDQGYIGSSLKSFLDHQIIGYDLVNNQDIMDYECLCAHMKGVDLVIHLAACSTIGACNQDPKLAFELNERGTENVLNAMKANQCPRIIYAGTSSVYGDGENITEGDPIDCQNIYAASKYAGELKIVESGLNYVIFRMFNIIGQVNSTYFGFDRLTGL